MTKRPSIYNLFFVAMGSLAVLVATDQLKESEAADKPVPAAASQKPAPAAPAEDVMKPGVLANTISFAITDSKTPPTPVLTIMGDGRIGPNPHWDQVCTALAQIKTTKTNYATLALIRALVAGYDKPCAM